ncbi:MAG: OadG family protein [Treponema sp.]|jgi:oxaloacetate decarboxylase gamma subunit|nr:OadG family protein [Treponema sp.]
MTILEMLEQSSVLTVLGMAIVFVFLWLMIVCVDMVGKLVQKMGWDKDIQSPQNRMSKNTGGTITPEVTAVLSAAVMEYRKKEGRDNE